MTTKISPFIKVYQMRRSCCIIWREPTTNQADNIIKLIDEAIKDAPHLTLEKIRLVDVICEKKKRYKAVEWTEREIIPEGYNIINKN